MPYPHKPYPNPFLNISQKTPSISTNRQDATTTPLPGPTSQCSWDTPTMAPPQPPLPSLPIRSTSPTRSKSYTITLFSRTSSAQSRHTTPTLSLSPSERPPTSTAVEPLPRSSSVVGADISPTASLMVPDRRTTRYTRARAAGRTRDPDWHALLQNDCDA